MDENGLTMRIGSHFNCTKPRTLGRFESGEESLIEVYDIYIKLNN
jgi:hypothetical protein